MDDLTREFLIESQEGLDRMERCLTDLEERPRGTALLAEIFRSVHTIKGTTGVLGFKRLEKLARAGENLLGLLRDEKLIADAAVITALLQLLDGLRGILKDTEAEGNEGAGEDGALIARLEELQAPAICHKGKNVPPKAAARHPGGQEPPRARARKCQAISAKASASAVQTEPETPPPGSQASTVSAVTPCPDASVRALSAPAPHAMAAPAPATADSARARAPSGGSTAEST